MRWKDNFFVFGILFLFLVQMSSQSQTFQAEIKSLARGSDVILTGKVVKQQSEWAQNKSRIITKTTILVDEYIKGNGSGHSITVSHPGGEVDGVGELYTHMPEFKDNEEVLLFLKKDKNSPDYKVYSGETGKVSLVRNKVGEKVTASNLSLDAIKVQIKSYTD